MSCRKKWRWYKRSRADLNALYQYKRNCHMRYFCFGLSGLLKYIASYLPTRTNSCNMIFSTLRPRQNGHHFPDDSFKRIFLNENNQISLKFALNGSLKNIQALVQIMAWRRLDDKPLLEPTNARSPTHICITRPVNNDKGYACIKSCWYIYDIFSWNHCYFSSLMAQKMGGMIEI